MTNPGNECLPVVANLFGNLRQYLKRFLLKHLHVDPAIVRETGRVMPAVHVLARGLLRRLVDVLPEIEEFSWVDFAACRYLEVRIRYLAVTVAIEAVKDLLELLIS